MPPSQFKIYLLKALIPKLLLTMLLFVLEFILTITMASSSLMSAKEIKCLSHYAESDILAGLLSLDLLESDQEMFSKISKKLLSTLELTAVDTIHIKPKRVLKKRQKPTKNELFVEALKKNRFSNGELRIQEDS